MQKEKKLQRSKLLVRVSIVSAREEIDLIQIN